MNRVPRSTISAVVVGATLLALPVVGAAPAAAGSAHPAHHTPGRHSENGGDWAGYAATSGTFTSVRASWIEPTATCTADRDLASPWVGIDGYGSETVEQIGTDVGCRDGQVVHAAWYEMYPADSVYFGNPVAAGDRMTASVTRKGNVYTLTETDATQGWSRSFRQVLAAQNVSAEVIVEAPGSYLPQFAPITFTGATINGAPLGAFPLVGMNARRDGQVLARTNAVTRGGTFTVRYVHE